MKIIICILLTFVWCFHYSQHKEEVVSAIDSSKIEFSQIQNQYFEILRNSQTLIYRDKKDGKYSYYIKSKYDSLTRIKMDDTIVLKNSIVKVTVNENEFYVAKLNNLKNEDYEFYRFKENTLLSVEKGNSISQTYTKNDLAELTLYDFCGNDNCLYKYTIAKYTTLNSEKELSDIKYSMQIDKHEGVYEQFYDKDFPVDDKMLLRTFISKFKKQSLILMKGKKYNRGHGSPGKEFDANDLEYEISLMQRIISEKQKAEAGFYDNKDSIKYNAQRGVGIIKKYDNVNKPYYYVIINIGMRQWEFRINPITGDIESSNYYLFSD